MKKIYSLSLLLLGALAFSSCSKDTDNPYATESTIKVVNSHLNFSAAPSEGSIVYTSDGAISVSTSSSWCKAVLVGDSVKVSATQNNSKSGRSATVVLRHGSDSLSLAVVQEGIITEIGKSTVSTTSDDAQSLSYSFTGNVDFEVVSYPDWTRARIANDSLYVDIDANNTGHLRSGYIVYKSDAFVDSIKVFQADFDRDIAGNYSICYQKSDSTEVTMRNKELTSTSLYVLRTLSLPITYDSDNGAITVQTGSYLGTNVNNGTTYYVYLAYMLTGDYWTGYTSGLTLSADLTYDDVNGTQAAFSGFALSRKVTALMFRRFSAQSFIETNDASSAVYYMYNPRIVRAPENTTSQQGVSSYIARP